MRQARLDTTFRPALALISAGLIRIDFSQWPQQYRGLKTPTLLLLVAMRNWKHLVKTGDTKAAPQCTKQVMRKDVCFHLLKPLEKTSYFTVVIDSL